MQLPTRHGTLNQSEFYIFAAADTDYFDQFGPALVNSVLSNTSQGLHLHLFNPREDQIKFCDRERISVSWENVGAQDVEGMVNNWNNLTEEQRRRTTTAMDKGQDKDVGDRMLKTYYACARFIRLAEMFQGPVLAIDVDAVVRRPIPALPTSADFHLHRIYGKKARCLAGGLYLQSQAQAFINAYADSLKRTIDNDYLYWGVDQDVLDELVPQYNHGQLPSELIDWEMHDSGVIWTAKGTRKHTEKFIQEQNRYKG